MVEIKSGDNLRHILTSLKIVEANEIPAKEKIVSPPIDDLLMLYKVFKALENICVENYGIGLSAVQAGIPWKIFVALTGYEALLCVDCEYSPIGTKKIRSIEGCLSLKKPNGDLRLFSLERFSIIEVKGKILVHKKGKLILEDFDKVFSSENHAAVFQHEIDHHNGILISDIGKEVEISSFR